MAEADKRAALAKAARKLNEAGVGWALGASALLWFAGAAETYHDFDLLIAPGDMPSAREAMRAAGGEEGAPPPPSAVYATAAFAEFRLGDADFDLLCGFAVRYQGETYRYPFTRGRVAGEAEACGERIPLSPLADWYVLYRLMPGRAERAQSVARALNSRPRAEWVPWLRDWLAFPLPGDVRESVENLLAP